MDPAADLHPPTYWGQTSKNVTLRIGLVAVKDPAIKINDKSVKFQSLGCSGSRGEQVYSFEIDLFDEIDAQGSSYKMNDREINVILRKGNDKEKNPWPRLTKSQAKLPWLKPDFDKMAFSEDESDEEKKQSMFKKFNEESNRSFKPMDRRNGAKAFIDYRTYWLLFFNLFQFMAYFWVFSRLVIWWSLRSNLTDSYAHVENVIKICQAVSFLEIVHPMIGFTKGDWTSPLIQFLGRNFILFIIVGYNRGIQSTPFVGYLLIVWSFIELFRYPFYSVRLLKKDIAILTWLRYTLWIGLYPLGAFLEGLLVYKSLEFYDKNRYFSLDLPNSWNFAFNFGLFLRIYLFVMPLALLHMMRYMSIQRKKTLKKKNN